MGCRLAVGQRILVPSTGVRFSPSQPLSSQLNMARSSSGLGRRPLKAEISSSNLLRATKKSQVIGYAGGLFSCVEARGVVAGACGAALETLPAEMRAWARKWRPSSDFVRNCCQNVPLGVKMTPNHRVRAGLLRKLSSERQALPAPLQRPAPPQPLRAYAAGAAPSTRRGCGSKPALCCLAQRRRKRCPN